MSRWISILGILVCALTSQPVAAAESGTAEQGSLERRGDPPLVMPLQINLTDAMGAAISTEVTLDLAIWNVPTPGTGFLLWGPETHTVTPQSGIANILLGNNSSGLSPNDFDGSTRYLAIQVNGGAELDPRLPMGQVAYSLFSQEAVTAASAGVAFGVVNDVVTGGSVVDGSLTGSDINDRTIGGVDIATDQIGSTELANSVLFGTESVDGTISVQTGPGLADGIQLRANGDGGYGWFRQPNGNVGIQALCYSNDSATFQVMRPDGVVATENVSFLGNSGGMVHAFNSSGASSCGLNGTNGTVFGSNIALVLEDPQRDGRLIRYSGTQGPEDTIQLRGKGRLVGGRAVVEFPEHFSILASPGTVTVTLTPGSASSLGLAAIDVTAERAEIGELQSGAGTYDFYYEVSAVRQGTEDRKVYVSRAEWDREDERAQQRVEPGVLR